MTIKDYDLDWLAEDAISPNRPALSIDATEVIFSVLRRRAAIEKASSRSNSYFHVIETLHCSDEQQYSVNIRNSQLDFVKDAVQTLSDPNTRTLVEIFEALPEAERAKLLDVAKTFQAKAKNAAPPLPPVGGAYERFDHLATNWTKDRLRAYMGRVWGPWLKAFTPSLPADAITRPELKERDPALYRKLVRDFPAVELASIIQTLSQRLDAQVATTAIDAAVSGDTHGLSTVAERMTRRKQRARGRTEEPEPT